MVCSNKLGVKPDYLTCGDYKSAGEMFMLTGPSAPAQENLNWLIDSIFDSSLELIAKGRKVEEEQVRSGSTTAFIRPKRRREAGIIDQVQYRQDFVGGIEEEFGDDAGVRQEVSARRRAWRSICRHHWGF